MKTVTSTSTVDVEYEGRLDDGTLFDTSKESLAKEEGIYAEGRPYEPLHVTLGQGSLIKGFENALVGMSEGEEKDIKIKAIDAYGEVREELIQHVKRDSERDKDVQEGMMVVVNIQGRQVPAMVTGVSDDELTLDFNHPLAGKDLNFKLKVVKIEE